MRKITGRIQKALAGLVCGVLLLVSSSAAWACPVCDSGTGKAVRAGVFGRDFGFNLLVSVAPFAVCALIVAAIYYGPTSQPRLRGEQ